VTNFVPSRFKISLHLFSRKITNEFIFKLPYCKNTVHFSFAQMFLCASASAILSFNEIHIYVLIFSSVIIINVIQCTIKHSRAKSHVKMELYSSVSEDSLPLQRLQVIRVYFEFRISGASQTLYILGSQKAMLSGSLVTTAWRVLRLRIEETASRFGG
jgi:hypothetical protein